MALSKYTFDRATLMALQTWGGKLTPVFKMPLLPDIYYSDVLNYLRYEGKYTDFCISSRSLRATRAADKLNLENYLYVLRVFSHLDEYRDSPHTHNCLLNITSRLNDTKIEFHLNDAEFGQVRNFLMHFRFNLFETKNQHVVAEKGQLTRPHVNGFLQHFEGYYSYQTENGDIVISRTSIPRADSMKVRALQAELRKIGQVIEKAASDGLLFMTIGTMHDTEVVRNRLIQQGYEAEILPNSRVKISWK